MANYDRTPSRMFWLTVWNTSLLIHEGIRSHVESRSHRQYGNEKLRHRRSAISRISKPVNLPRSRLRRMFSQITSAKKRRTKPKHWFIPIPFPISLDGNRNRTLDRDRSVLFFWLDDERVTIQLITILYKNCINLNIVSIILDEHPSTPVEAIASLSMIPKTKIGIDSRIWILIGKTWVNPWALVSMKTCLVRIRNFSPRRAISPWNLRLLVIVQTVHNLRRQQSCLPIPSRLQAASFNGYSNPSEKCWRNTFTLFWSRRTFFSFRCSFSF